MQFTIVLQTSSSKQIYHFDLLFILGNGCYANTVKYCCDKLNIKYKNITRNNWNEINNIKNSVIFNCTPVENINIDNSNKYINCINTTKTGGELAKIQASFQFKLYTGLEFPLK